MLFDVLDTRSPAHAGPFELMIRLSEMLVAVFCYENKLSPFP